MTNIDNTQDGSEDLNAAPNEVADELVDSDDALSLHKYAEMAYLKYAMSVVTARALPQVEDGQKPVVRRFLFTMFQLGLTATSKHIKSARVVGDVLGKLHPHGDSSVYEAMVRTAQDFTLRYPLIDGQGNFGSRDGDGAAAMRYTEVRLTKFSVLLLSEINRGTVDFIPNYDGAFTEPKRLPARLPFLLLNGAKGPAVGYRPEVPPHNLREVAQGAVAVIRNPDITVEEMMRNIPGPDFPGGGQIISAPSALLEAYTTGRGSIRMRARWRREELARGQYRIVVYELPSGVSTASVLIEIEAASNPQVKAGKKELSQDQKNTKALMLGVVDSAKDESDKKEPVRLVLEPKSSKIDEAELMAALMAHTSLESSVPINLVMIGLDGAPNQKNIVAILKEWTSWRIATVERRTLFRLAEIAARLHILDGRLIAFINIDEIIRVIRHSEDPKADLMSKFSLSETQAEDILEIRLRQLARLEGVKLEKEINELRIEQAGLQVLIDSRPALVDQVVSEIESDSKEYGDDRRTLIEASTPMLQSGGAPALDEPVTVILSTNGWLRARAGHGLDRTAISYKDGDHEGHVLETRTTNPVCFIDTTGRAYSIKASEAPTGRGDGVPLSSLIEIQGGAKILHAITGGLKDSYLFCGSEAYGYVTELENLVAKKRAGKAFLTVADGELPMPPARVPVATNSGEPWVTCVSEGKDARLLMFPVSEVKVMSGGKGVVLMDLGEKSVLKSVFLSDGAALTVVTEAKSEVLEGDGLKKYRLHRARKGCQMPLKNARVVAGKPAAK